ncbi:MAG: tripartite tricarboxylate transporter substrate binding protein [Burkholderiaceae bacterium]|nr:tripartite tricarboxylate transporter substrate binding protein [Burkholderiaceae bacterium]
MNTRRQTAIWLAAAMIALGASGAQAQAYPSKPIRIVVPFGPGSGADIMGRILADKLSEQMNVRVFVENRDGAGGAIGTTHVAAAAPDGYTLVLNPSSAIVSLQATPPYDPIRDFAPVSKIAMLPLVLVSGMNAPFKTAPELIAYARANPGRLSYANSGRGASTHLEAELLKYRYKLNITDVPYKSFGQAITDTISGEVALYFPAFPAALPHIKGGKVRGLAIGSLTRSSQLPDVPTLAEALNAPGYEAVVWYGIWAPANTPQAIVSAIDAQLDAALKSTEVQQRLSKVGVEAAYMPSDKFGAMVREETTKWRRLIDELGLRTPK